jgi:hypothetical protein
MLGNLLQFAAKVADGVEAETSTEDKYWEQGKKIHLDNFHFIIYENIKIFI